MKSSTRNSVAKDKFRKQITYKRLEYIINTCTSVTLQKPANEYSIFCCGCISMGRFELIDLHPPFCHKIRHVLTKRSLLENNHISTSYLEYTRGGLSGGKIKSRSASNVSA